MTICLTAEDQPVTFGIAWSEHQGDPHFHLVESHVTATATDFRVVVYASKVSVLTAMAT